jgi:glycosyltransferase involved in cell wall biosynthesis
MHPALNALPSVVSRRIPVITTFHDLRVPYLFPKAGRLRKQAIVQMARGSDAVIVTNPADGRALMNERIESTQIPIGPNLPPPGRVGVVEEDTVAFFGFPAQSKGIVDLIQAMGTLPVPRPTLLLIGAQGEPGSSNDILTATDVDTLAARAGVRVRRSGYLPPREASEALAVAGVIALPFVDGASLRSGSLLAALQSGRPVVTTRPHNSIDLDDLACLPQLLLADRGDGESLAAAIGRALTWTGSPSSLPQPFRWQSIAIAHDALYRSVLGERRT